MREHGIIKEPLSVTLLLENNCAEVRPETLAHLEVHFVPSKEFGESFKDEFWGQYG